MLVDDGGGGGDHHHGRVGAFESPSEEGGDSGAVAHTPGVGAGSQGGDGVPDVDAAIGRTLAPRGRVLHAGRAPHQDLQVCEERDAGGVRRRADLHIGRERLHSLVIIMFGK